MHDQRKSTVILDEATRKAQETIALQRVAEYKTQLADYQARRCTTEALEANATLLQHIPEGYTLYAYRRIILERLYLDPCRAARVEDATEAAEATAAAAAALKEELALNSRILLKDFKIYAAFVHRHWIFEQLLKLSEKATGTAAIDSSPVYLLLLKALEKEREQIEKLLQLDERNFHAWNYRRWALATQRRAQALRARPLSTSASLEGGEAERPPSPPSRPQLFSPEEVAELRFTAAKIRQNFSNYSAWHQRGLILSTALQRWETFTPAAHGMGEKDADADAARASTCAYRALGRALRRDAAMLIHSMFCDPNDQAAWFYAPYVVEVEERHHDALLLLAAAASAADAGEGAKDEDEDEDEEQMPTSYLTQHPDVTDALVHAVIDLLGVEMQLRGGGGSCLRTDAAGEAADIPMLPFYFLLRLLTGLRSLSKAAAAAPSTDGAGASSTGKETPDARAARRLAAYTSALCAQVFKERDAADVEGCLRELQRCVTLADPMRRGMYASLLSEAKP